MGNGRGGREERSRKEGCRTRESKEGHKQQQKERGGGGGGEREREREREKREREWVTPVPTTRCLKFHPQAGAVPVVTIDGKGMDPRGQSAGFSGPEALQPPEQGRLHVDRRAATREEEEGAGSGIREEGSRMSRE